MNAFPRRNDYFPCSLSFSFFWGFLSSFSLLCSIDPQKLLIVCRVCSSAREQGIYLLCNKTCFLRKRVREKEKKSLASNILSYVARNELYVNIRSSLFSKYVCIASFDGEKERERDKECVWEREKTKETRDRETVLERASPSTIYERIYFCAYTVDAHRIKARFTFDGQRGMERKKTGEKEKGGKDKRAQSMPLSMRRTVGPLSPCETSFEIKLNWPWIFTRRNSRDTTACITLLLVARSLWISRRRMACARTTARRKRVRTPSQHSSLLLTRP